MTEKRKNLRTISAILSICRGIFQKPAANLAAEAGAPIRTAEYWLGSGSLPSEALCSLIQTEHGQHILETIMSGHEPLWWKKHQARQAYLDSVKATRDAKRKLDEVQNAFAELEDIERQAEDALAVSREDRARARRHSLGQAPRLGGLSLVQK